MTPKEFFDKVSRMRKAQKEYFRTRSGRALADSKRLEKEIDAPHNKYDIMKHNQHGWWQKAPGGGWCAAEHTPIGWRHIHEI